MPALTNISMGTNLSALNAHMTNGAKLKSYACTELKEGIRWNELHWFLIQLERSIYQEPNKQGMSKVYMRDKVTKTTIWHSQPITWKDRSYTSTTSEVMSQTTQASFWHLRELRLMNILIDCPRMKQNHHFRRREESSYNYSDKWNTDWQMLQQITKSPINNQRTTKTNK
jgi:hypothetical protein